MATDTQTPQFSGSGSISPGSGMGAAGTLHSDPVQSGVVRGAGDVTGRISAEVGAVGDGLHEGVSRTVAGVRKGAARAELRSRRWLEHSRSGVRRRPLIWLGLALVAGAAIARLVR
jgi:hypothetical protein